MKQRSFFDDERAGASPDPSCRRKEGDALRVARIVFPAAPEGTFDYEVPPHLGESLLPGMRVTVPLGKSNRGTLGYCVEVRVETLSREERARLKSVSVILDSGRLLSEKMLHLARWIAEYYLCPPGVVLEAMLPAGVRTRAASRLTTVYELPDDLHEKLGRLRETGRSQKQDAFPTKKQLHVLKVLRESPEPLSGVELAGAAKCSQAPIQALKRSGLIRSKSIRRETDSKNTTEIEISPRDRTGHRLNAQQQYVRERVLAAVERGGHETFLLRGVTGSGKTEVYIQIIEEVVRHGKQAVVLVPEIALTPQTVARFKGRFRNVAVLHSHLSDAERSRQWNRIMTGAVQVVVGARSAVFAPLPNPGVMIIDEEHESSFKQDVAPRYHARDVAKKRAEMERIPLLLASATPSLESWSRARKGIYRLLTISNRVLGLSLPSVRIVDLRDAARARTTRGAIHRELHAAIYETLQKKEQVLLLLNRRGFSTHIQCPACGTVMKCPDCDVSLTHHRTEDIALCHYCDYQVPAPPKCPRCDFHGIRYSGFGTQKLEHEIRSRFPAASVLRMDTDTMHGRGAHERALAKFRSGEVQILLGTQMIAKGLDFPNVTLVGVINADTSLHLPDFRASERTFLLVTQVAGRTGRGEKGGRVIVQTFNPDHDAILAAARHDYQGFVDRELPLRELLGYPPYTNMVRFVVRGPDERRTSAFANRLAERLREHLKKRTESSRENSGRNPPTDNGPGKPRLLGPAPAPFAKLRGYFRFHIHMHLGDAALLRDVFYGATENLDTPRDVQWIVDVDPMDML